MALVASGNVVTVLPCPMVIVPEVPSLVGSADA
jgi:hypothetical protein